MSQTVSTSKRDYHIREIDVGQTEHGRIGISNNTIGCSNINCKKVTVDVRVGTVLPRAASNLTLRINKDLYQSQIYPASTAKPQPEYIPKPIIEDYTEACAIRDLSPKASATLIRRCLQGVIRDFCEISENRLIDEINALKEQVETNQAPQGVTLDRVEAIDAVKSIGNIGAHMEKDINVIVDVDSNEAQILIELVENLFEEWYVARHKRTERFKKINDLANAKKTARKQVADNNEQQSVGLTPPESLIAKAKKI